jgi:peroxidase
MIICFSDVDDIDLFAGGIYETPVEGGIVGPTFACIIGHTFHHSRRGDRFWYENEGAGFTPGKLKRFEVNYMNLREISIVDYL